MCFSIGFILYETLCTSGLECAFPFLREFLAIISSNTLSGPSSPSGTPIMKMLVHLMPSQKSLDCPHFYPVPKQWFPAIWCPAHFFVCLIYSTTDSIYCIFHFSYCSSLFFKASSSLYPLGLCLHLLSWDLDLLYYYYSEFLFKEIACLHFC